MVLDLLLTSTTSWEIRSDFANNTNASGVPGQNIEPISGTGILEIEYNHGLFIHSSGVRGAQIISFQLTDAETLWYMSMKIAL